MEIITGNLAAASIFVSFYNSRRTNVKSFHGSKIDKDKSHDQSYDKLDIRLSDDSSKFKTKLAIPNK